MPKDALDADAALCFVTEKSVLFVIPWGEYWIIGTTDTDWEKGLSLPDPAPTKADIDYILDQVNQRVSRTITRSDIVGVYRACARCSPASLTPPPSCPATTPWPRLLRASSPLQAASTPPTASSVGRR